MDSSSEDRMDPFQLLGVPEDATPEEIESAYHRKREELLLKALARYGLSPPSEEEDILQELDRARDLALKRRKEKEPPLDERPLETPSPEPLPSPSAPPSGGESPVGDWEKRLWDGSFLKAIRMSRNLSLESIAQTLKISRTQLEALENHRYHLLPPLVYVKGFLRAYAKLLRIDPERLVKDYLSRWEGISGKKEG